MKNMYFNALIDFIRMEGRNVNSMLKFGKVIQTNNC